MTEKVDGVVKSNVMQMPPPPKMPVRLPEQKRSTFKLGAFDLVVPHIIFIDNVKETDDKKFVIRVVFNNHEVNVFYDEKKNADLERSALITTINSFYN